MHLPVSKKLLFLATGFVLGYSAIFFAPRLAHATDYLFGKDASNNFVIRERVSATTPTPTPFFVMSSTGGITSGNMNASQISQGTFGASTGSNGTYTFPQNIITSGNVGIGTTGPAAKLHVASGNIYITSGGDYGLYSYDGANARHLIKQGSDNKLYIGQNSAHFGEALFSVSGAENMMILKSGNVGIGTTGPAQKLDVNGNIAVAASNGFYARYTTDFTYSAGLTWSGLQLGNNGTNYIVSGRTAAGAGLGFVVNNSNDYSYGGGYNGTLAMSITNAGNVGIGTTGPARTLDVIGAIRTSTGGLYSAGSALGVYTDAGAALPVKVGSLTVSDTYADSAPATGMYIKGNVGIGATPDAKLRVAGNTYLSYSGTNLGVQLVNDSNSADYGQILIMGYTDTNKRLAIGYHTTGNYGFLQPYSSAGYGNLALNPLGGNVGIGTTAPPNKLHVSGSIGATGWIGAGCEGSCETSGGYALMYADGTIVATSTVTAPTFSGALSGNATTATTATTANAVSFNSGLTTGSSPTFAGLTSTGTLTFSQANPTISASSYFIAPGGAYFSSGTVYTEATIQARGGIADDGGDLNLLDNVYISGSVGIGTTGPGALLDLYSTTAWSSGLMNNLRITSTTYPTLRFFATSGNKTSTIFNSNDGSLQFGVNGSGDAWGSYAMSITPGGNVGIGTTGPTNKLDVAGYVTGQYFYSSALGLYAIHGLGTAGYIPKFTGTGGTYTVGNSLIYDTGSYVGIGTASPGYPLTVAGNNIVLGSYTSVGTMYSGADAVFGNNVYADPSSRVIRQTISGYYPNWIRMYYNYGIAFGTSTAAGTAGDIVSTPGGTTNERMIITNAGLVGIGTAGPSYALQVAGTVYASGSSIDYKQNITDLEIDSNKIYDLHPVSFDYKKEWEKLGYTLAGGRQIGLIAEDAYKVIPELVISIPDKKTANIDYEKLSVLLLDQMKKLKNTIDSQDKQLKDQKERMDKLQEQITSLTDLINKEEKP